MHRYKNCLVFCLLLSANLIAQDQPAPDTLSIDGKIFQKVEVEADFPGGQAAWYQYLKKTLNPNVPADNAAPVGRYTVIAKFVIGRDGSLTDLAAETNLGYGMEKEVLRILQKSGKWNPARKDGKPINAYRRQPVTFQVEEDGFEVTSKVPFTVFTGTDNIINVEIRKVKNSNITLSISQGSITSNDNDQFVARVNEPGRVIITAYLKKNNKVLGMASFEVKTKN